LTYDAFTPSITNREQERDLRLLERVLEERGRVMPTVTVEPPGHAWRRELKLRGRDSDRRTRNDHNRCPWVHELRARLSGLEPHVGSFHVDEPDELTYAEWLRLQKAEDEEVYADELELYAIGDGVFGHEPQDGYQGEPLDGFNDLDSYGGPGYYEYRWAS
jgi:hypothetical protein